MEAITIRIPESVQFDDDQLFDFCIANKELRIERDAKGQLIIMSPVGLLGSSQNLSVASALWQWNDTVKKGIVFDSSGGFRLQNGAVRSPDAAWVSLERWNKLTSEQQRKLAPIAPDFIIEVRSESDSLKDLKQKMEEWIDNGCRLAWLIDPLEQKAYIYKPTVEMIHVNDFNRQLCGEGVLPGFVLDLAKLKPTP